MTLRIEPLRFDAEPSSVEAARMLLTEYLAFAEGSSGFQMNRLAQEIQDLPASYASQLLIAYRDDVPVGCVALRPLADRAEEKGAEMKRMWVRESARRNGVAEALATALIDLARIQGHRAIYLDTEPGAMDAAYRLYLRLGFRPCEPYRDASDRVAYLRLAL